MKDVSDAFALSANISSHSAYVVAPTTCRLTRMGLVPLLQLFLYQRRALGRSFTRTAIPPSLARLRHLQSGFSVQPGDHEKANDHSLSVTMGKFPAPRFSWSRHVAGVQSEAVNYQMVDAWLRHGPDTASRAFGEIPKRIPAVCNASRWKLNLTAGSKVTKHHETGAGTHRWNSPGLFRSGVPSGWTAPLWVGRWGRNQHGSMVC